MCKKFIKIVIPNRYEPELLKRIKFNDKTSKLNLI